MNTTFDTPAPETPETPTVPPIRVDELTLGELGYISRGINYPVAEVFEKGTSHLAFPDMLAYVVVIAHRRAGNLSYTADMAQGLTMDQASAYLEASDAPGEEMVAIA